VAVSVKFSDYPLLLRDVSLAFADQAEREAVKS